MPKDAQTIITMNYYYFYAVFSFRSFHEFCVELHF